MSKSANDVFYSVVRQHRDIVSRLVERIPQLAEDETTRAWTIAAKRALHDLCIEYLGPCQAHFSASHHCDGDLIHNEWLLDALWSCQSDHFHAILLGLESEWIDSTDEVCNDFSKLLAVKAPIKIGIFSESNRKRKPRRLTRLEGLNRMCAEWAQHSTGDLLYAINFHDGRHDTYFYEAKSAGQIPHFAFVYVPELSGADKVIPKAVPETLNT